jgi:sulfite reductase (NADPH) hemoprotein beta-component
MYQYDALDQSVIDARVEQFADQTQRFSDGTLAADDYRPLRLQNGLYVQKHAPMLRIAIPYGELRADQLRSLADVAERYDEGYGHFTTRQNLQLNGPKIDEVPALLADLAKVQMHAVQTSGNCIRNVTVDHFAGVDPDEVADPRPVAELLRQWSTDHPEFSFLPRKFKIAVTGSPEDRAALRVHDVGLRLVRDAQGQVAVDVYVGGGLGRTPIVAPLVLGAVPIGELLDALEAVLRVYNLHGRRDNLYKARIKILVRDLGSERFAAEVREQWARGRANALSPSQVLAEYQRIAAHFLLPLPLLGATQIENAEIAVSAAARQSVRFAAWLRTNVFAHRQAGFCAVTVSLKGKGQVPGDASSRQMRDVAALAERFSLAQVRVSHHQNLVLPHVQRGDLPALHEALRLAGLATANIGLVTDIIACPGGDFCSLANARSLPLAAAIQQRFEALGIVEALGALQLNISGCINSCGHHHVGDIGLLGVDKHDEEFFQITVGGHQGGGSQGEARIGKILGRALPPQEIPEALARIAAWYLEARHGAKESFAAVVQRVGIEPLKALVYTNVVDKVAA